MWVCKLTRELCVSKDRLSYYERLILFKEHHVLQGLWQTLNPHYITLRHLRPLPVSTPPLVTYPCTPPPPPRPQHMPNTPTPVLTFPHNNLGIGSSMVGRSVAVRNSVCGQLLPLPLRFPTPTQIHFGSWRRSMASWVIFWGLLGLCLD